MVSANNSIGEMDLKLPPLLVKIERAGVVVRTVELKDPREAYCRAFAGSESEFTASPAYPVSRAT